MSKKSKKDNFNEKSNDNIINFKNEYYLKLFYTNPFLLSQLIDKEIAVIEEQNKLIEKLDNTIREYIKYDR